MESAIDANNTDTFGDIPVSNESLSLESLSLQTKSIAETIPDTVFSAFDAIESSLGDLIDEADGSETTDVSASGNSAEKPVPNLWNDGLLAPDQFLNTETTSVAGQSIGSIWGMPSAAPAPPTATTSRQGPKNTDTSTDKEILTVAELERRLAAKNAPVPAAPPGSARPPPGLSVPQKPQAPPGIPEPVVQQSTSKKDHPQAPHGLSEKKPSSFDTLINASTPNEKETPILNQLQAAQEQRQLQQKLNNERAQFEAKMRDLGQKLAELRGHMGNMHARVNEARLQLAQPNPPPQFEEQRPNIHANMMQMVGAIQGLERQCVAIGKEQMQTQRNFELFQVKLAVEGGNSEQHRLMLEERLRQLESTLKSNSEGLAGLQLQMAQLQHQYGTMTAAKAKEPAESSDVQIEGIRKNIDFLSRNLAAGANQKEQLQSQLKHTKNLLAELPTKDVQREPSEYNNLMSESEKQWLIKIQAKQMHSDNPYVDDFYAHALIRKRAGQMRAAAAKSGMAPPNITTPKAPAPVTKKRDSKFQKPMYTPADLSGTLGQIRATSIRAPQQLIKMPVIGDDDDGVSQDESEMSREYQERSRRRKVLLAIEQGYRLLLLIEDRYVKLEDPTLPRKVRNGVEKDAYRLLTEFFQLLEVNPPDKTWERHDDQLFRQCMTIFKGKMLIARYMRFAAPEQAHAVLLVALRTMTTVITPLQRSSGLYHSKHMEELSMVMLPSLLARIDNFDIGTIVSCLKTVTSFYVGVDDEKKRKMHEPYCVALLYALFRRADGLLGASSTKPETQMEWCALVELVASGTAQTLGQAIKDLDVKSSPSQYLWEYANILAAHSGQSGKATLREHLENLVLKENRPPFMDLFMNITTPTTESG